MDAYLEWIEERMVGEKSKTGAKDNVFKSDLPLKGSRNREIIRLGHGDQRVYSNGLNNSVPM